MRTRFASAERAADGLIAKEIRTVSENPLMSALLTSVHGLLAVLDEHRQIVAINDSFLMMLGVDDPRMELGLRPGEALGCMHADEEPAGCGTTSFCRTCGAAVAIVASLGKNAPVERTCALRARRDGRTVDIVLAVKSQPIEIDGSRFLLLFAQDITLEQQRAALERVFFHDINNMLGVLLQASEMLSANCSEEIRSLVQDVTRRLSREVEIQRSLSKSHGEQYRPLWHRCGLRTLLESLERLVRHHPESKGKRIEISQGDPDMKITTDVAALSRILCNMVINALEATEEEGTVRVWTEPDGDHVSFCVWNVTEIPEDVRLRVFQRNFSTKAQSGRGLGTYSMKLLGEEILGGRVWFTSSEENGTTFRFEHPVDFDG